MCDGKGTPFKVITTAANVNDVTQTLALVDGIPAVAGRLGRSRHRPDAVLGDKGYDSNPNRRELRRRRIVPVISRKGAPNIKGLGKLRYVVEQTFSLLHHWKPSYMQGFCWAPMTCAVEAVSGSQSGTILIVTSGQAHPSNWVGVETEPIPPAHVAPSNREARDQGWDPTRGGSPFRLDRSTGLIAQP
ncbi:transposase [Streptomyces sp. NPDC005908]|uniref:transposase n=1 Tax=Streptomyces sp. NPDC005908 TaxID=3157084 RepID=UPI0033C66C51